MSRDTYRGGNRLPEYESTERKIESEEMLASIGKARGIFGKISGNIRVASGIQQRK